MKNILKIVVLLSFISCKAQIVNIEDECSGTDAGKYYKDVNNLLNPYEGTWKYQNGNQILLVKLRKVFSTTTSTTADMLIGEYQYIDENGIEKINTLSNFNQNQTNQSFHAIFGNCINLFDQPTPTSYITDVKKVVLLYNDPIKEVAGDFYLAKAIVGGNEAIQLFVKTTGHQVIDNTVPGGSLDLEYIHVGATIPKGWYTLIKQ